MSKQKYKEGDIIYLIHYCRTGRDTFDTWNVHRLIVEKVGRKYIYTNNVITIKLPIDQTESDTPIGEGFWKIYKNRDELDREFFDDRSRYKECKKSINYSYIYYHN